MEVTVGMVAKRVAQAGVLGLVAGAGGGFDGAEEDGKLPSHVEGVGWLEDAPHAARRLATFAVALHEAHDLGSFEIIRDRLHGLQLA